MTGNLYEPSIRRILEMLGAVPPHHVAVYQTNDSTCAQLGELSAVSLRARGAVGVVLEGGTRDVDFIVHEGFPVFSAATRRHRTRCRAGTALPGAGHEVEICGVRVTTGDAVREGMAPLEAYERFGKF